jgi:membrane protein DedA with SNARE-associated domain
MDRLAAIMTAYGGAAVFAASFLENIGLPIPAFPVFMVAGAFAATGSISAGWALAGAVLGALAADGVWYELGRWRGRRLLSTLCRLSLNPDACVERTEDGFHRRKNTTILFGKFLPGISLVAPPLAGIASFPRHRFILMDFLGSVLWAGLGLGIGWFFGSEIARRTREFHGALTWLFGGGALAYFAWRLLYRRYLVRRYSVPRIGAEELRLRMAEDDSPLVLDLRSDRSFEASNVMVEGARRLRPASFHRLAHELPRDRELVFYCS